MESKLQIQEFEFFFDKLEMFSLLGSYSGTISSILDSQRL